MGMDSSCQNTFQRRRSRFCAQFFGDCLIHGAPTISIIGI